MPSPPDSGHAVSAVVKATKPQQHLQCYFSSNVVTMPALYYCHDSTKDFEGLKHREPSYVFVCWHYKYMHTNNIQQYMLGSNIHATVHLFQALAGGLLLSRLCQLQWIFLLASASVSLLHSCLLTCLQALALPLAMAYPCQDPASSQHSVLTCPQALMWCPDQTHLLHCKVG